jgi:hypothetical protein
MTAVEQKLLATAVERLKNFERDTIARLTRVEENLFLLRKDLMGDGHPGRIVQMENTVTDLRSDFQRQRGVFAAITFLISAAVALVSRFFNR